MNIKGRLERLEMKVFDDVGISKEDKLIIIPFKTEDKLNRLKKERMDELRQKYGPNISEDDLLVIGIRKFCRKHLSSDDAKPGKGRYTKNEQHS